MSLKQHIEGVLRTELSGQVLANPLMALLRLDASHRHEEQGNLHAAEFRMASFQRDLALTKQLEGVTWSIHSILSRDDQLQCIAPLTSDHEIEGKVDFAVERAIETYLQNNPKAIRDLYPEASLAGIDIDEMSEGEDPQTYIVSWYLNEKIYDSDIVRRIAELLRHEPGQARIATSPSKDRT